ncbi:unnamed protein product [Lathyrus oleraceus]
MSRLWEICCCSSKSDTLLYRHEVGMKMKTNQKHDIGMRFCRATVGGGCLYGGCWRFYLYSSWWSLSVLSVSKKILLSIWDETLLQGKVLWKG